MIQRLDALAKALNIPPESPTSDRSEPSSFFPTSQTSLLWLPSAASTTSSDNIHNQNDRDDNNEVEVRVSNETVLRVSRSIIPDPPLISYAKDIGKLNRVWDNTSPFWSPKEAPFQIEGTPVALIYWKELYAYGKAGHWKATKSKWADWKVSHTAFAYVKFLTVQ